MPTPSLPAKKIKELAASHERTYGSIRSELIKQGLITIEASQPEAATA